MEGDRDFTPLVTERLRLRRSVPDDAPAIAMYRNDPDVGRYQGWDRTDAEGIRAEIEAMGSRLPGDPGWVQLTVEERDTGRLVGDVGLAPADGEPGVVKIGYTIDPAHQGRGYATEAVRALVGYAFDRLGASMVRAYANARNLPSIRVAEKVGLTLMERFEGTHKGHHWTGVRYELRKEDAEPRSGA